VLINLNEDLSFHSFYKALKRTRPFNDEPKFYQYSCEINGLDEDSFGSGISLNEDIAKIKAIGESIERQALANNGLSAITKKFSDISTNAADPSLWLDIDKLKDSSLVDRLRLTEFRWLEGVNIFSESKIYVPAQLVFVPYTFGNEPLLRMPISTGAAFGLSIKDSISRGILEAVERDAFMMNYLVESHSPRIIHPQIDIFKKYLSRYKLTLDVFCMENEFKIPVALSIVRDTTGIGPYLTAGLKADFSIESAITGSVLESIHVRSWLRFSYSVDGNPTINSPKGITDLKTRGYYWYKNTENANLKFLLDHNNETDMSEYANSSIKNLLEYLNVNKFHVFYVNITNPNHPGFVTKTLVSELQPLKLIESKDFFKSERLSALKKEGYNITPHPFT
jgi:thiazole/oxazole-forming peptide maturase SagD family component